jgi:hypothetical protein
MSRTIARAASRPETAYLPAYNLFRRKEEPALVCAVPETTPAPSFLDEAWEFRGKIEDPTRAPRGFKPHAAQAAARRAGFYLFHMIDT